MSEMIGTVQKGAFTQDGLKTTHPVSNDILRASEILAVFDGVSYEKVNFLHINILKTILININLFSEFNSTAIFVQHSGTESIQNGYQIIPIQSFIFEYWKTWLVCGAKSS